MTNRLRRQQRLKYLLCTDIVLAHYDPSLDLSISCDTSEVIIGAVLFHCYSDGSASVSKTLTDTQHSYSQIYKDALAVGGLGTQEVPSIPLWKHFILVKDHKSLLALFGPSKETHF